MAKRKMMAKVHYNDKTDTYELWLKRSDEDEWGFSQSAKCMRVEGDTGANHVHYSFLRAVMECLRLGYEVFEG